MKQLYMFPSDYVLRERVKLLILRRLQHLYQKKLMQSHGKPFLLDNRCFITWIIYSRRFC